LSAATSAGVSALLAELRDDEKDRGSAFDAWLGVVVGANSVEGEVGVDELLLEAAFASSRPAPTRRPPTKAGVSTWATGARDSDVHGCGQLSLSLATGWSWESASSSVDG
jgi:hypothetical protein